MTSIGWIGTTVLMKCGIAGLLIFVGLVAVAKTDETHISGKVQTAASIRLPTQGVLFIFARSKGVASGPPAAVVRLVNPKLPLEFSLGAENAMIPGIPFQGPFDVVARFSPSGDVMQKAGAFEGRAAAAKGVAVGQKNVVITIDKAL